MGQAEDSSGQAEDSSGQFMPGDRREYVYVETEDGILRARRAENNGARYHVPAQPAKQPDERGYPKLRISALLADTISSGYRMLAIMVANPDLKSPEDDPVVMAQMMECASSHSPSHVIRMAYALTAIMGVVSGMDDGRDRDCLIAALSAIIPPDQPAS